jgi:hypothetical protein
MVSDDLHVIRQEIIMLPEKAAEHLAVVDQGRRAHGSQYSGNACNDLLSLW